MPTYKVNSGIRYRADTGLEARCNDCAVAGQGPRYWPLTEEYWNFGRGFMRCRACFILHDRRRSRERYANDPEFKKRKDAQNMAYRKLVGPKVINDMRRRWRANLPAEHKQRILERQRQYNKASREAKKSA